MVHRPAARRRLSPSLLALALAIGTVAVAVGRDDVPPAGTVASVAGATGVAEVAPIPTGEVLAADSTPGRSSEVAADTARPDRPVVPARADADPAAVLVGAPGSRPTPRLPTAKARSEPRGSSQQTPATYRGRNHVWIPSLGIDRSVAGYACSNQSYPGDRVYRWGCAGANNVYLFGHAHSVFKALHDAYVRGSLRKGQEVFYADGDGTVRRYTISWWKVTTPTKGTWAYAAQADPSLTLQTCVGSKSQYRLIVRLHRAG